MTDDGESSPIEEPDPIDRKPFKGVTATIPGIIEAENFDEGNEGDSYGGTNTPGDAEVDKDYRGKDYARVLMNEMLKRSRNLGFKEVTFTTKPAVMRVGYGLYKRMGFEEVNCTDGVVSMRMTL